MVGLEDISKEDIAESMISKWDEMIRYEIKREPERIVNVGLKVKGTYQKEGEEIGFKEDIIVSVKTSRRDEYIEERMVSLEGIREIREIRNFYGRLKKELSLEDEVHISVESIELNWYK